MLWKSLFGEEKITGTCTVAAKQEVALITTILLQDHSLKSVFSEKYHYLIMNECVL
jgi:hypothetical protein